MTLREKCANDIKLKNNNADPNISSAILYYGYLHYPKGFEMNAETLAEIKRYAEMPDYEFQALVSEAITMRKGIE